MGSFLLKHPQVTDTLTTRTDKQFGYFYYTQQRMFYSKSFNKFPIH